MKLHNLKTQLRACNDPDNGRDRKLNEELRAQILVEIAELEGRPAPSSDDPWRAQAKARLSSVQL